ncbi:Hypothetical protein GLP15_3957 [Giardia lamblia P15]|uniref:Oxysterol-binding protein n=1 Tax=Giardia intestinalis (strain P15) TaxID=658858 RepID=E1F9G5_GIAIA|nr:Hypothetical protein GLP15_3957 [Giardia lamblia P15]
MSVEDQSATSTPSIVSSRPVSIAASLTSKGGFMITDTELTKAQRALTRECIANFGKSLFTGENIMRRSIPIKKLVWVPMSQIQQLTQQLLSNLSFLQRASRASGLERFELCVAYVLGCLYPTVVDQHKAFNPIIGECYEDYLLVKQGEDQVKVNVTGEQIANHPPTCLYTLCEDSADYKIIGGAELIVSIGLNKVRIVRKGINSICFATGNPRRITFEFPTFHLVGLLWGIRWGFFSGDLRICGYDYDENVSINEMCSCIPVLRKSTDHCRETTDTAFECVVKFQRRTNLNSVDGNITDKNNLKKSFVSGSWTDSLTIGNVQYNIVTSETDIYSIFSKKRLPMDGCVREDITMFMADEVDKANLIKAELEERQRNDRALRASGPSKV